MDLKELIFETCCQLKNHGINTTEQEVRRLFKLAADYYGHRDLFSAASDNAVLRFFTSLVYLRLLGAPVTLLEGEVTFVDLKIKVRPGVFLPRPETEEVAEFAVEKMSAAGATHIIDAGTGTGAIALFIASRMKKAHVVGTDINPAAVRLARENAQLNRVRNIEFRVESFHQTLASAERYDALVSNPPYLAFFEGLLLPVEVRSADPKEALFAGETGVEFYHLFLSQIGRVLKPGGLFVFEIGAGQRPWLTEIAARCRIDVKFAKDMSGKDRIAWGVYQG